MMKVTCVALVATALLLSVLVPGRAMAGSDEHELDEFLRAELERLHELDALNEAALRKKREAEAAARAAASAAADARAREEAGTAVADALYDMLDLVAADEPDSVQVIVVPAVESQPPAARVITMTAAPEVPTYTVSCSTGGTYTFQTMEARERFECPPARVPPPVEPVIGPAPPSRTSTGAAGGLAAPF